MHKPKKPVRNPDKVQVIWRPNKQITLSATIRRNPRGNIKIENIRRERRVHKAVAVPSSSPYAYTKGRRQKFEQDFVILGTTNDVHQGSGIEHRGTGERSGTFGNLFKRFPKLIEKREEIINRMKQKGLNFSERQKLAKALREVTYGKESLGLGLPEETIQKFIEYEKRKKRTN